jgi:WD40 repeat protein
MRALIALVCFPGTGGVANAMQITNPWGRDLPRVLASQPESQPPSGRLRHLRFSPDGRYVLAQDDSAVTVLTVQPLRVLFRVPAESASPAEFTPDSRQLLFVSSPPHVAPHKPEFAGPAHLERWSIANQSRAAFAEIPLRACGTWDLSPDGHVLACVDSGGTLRLVDVPSGGTIFEKKKFGQRSVTWNLEETLSPERAFPTFSGDPWSAKIDFSPDGSFVIAVPRGGAEGHAVAFDLHEKRTVILTRAMKKLDSWPKPYFTAVSPDRILISPPYTPHGTVTAALVAFPSGRILSRPKLPRSPLFRAADPRFVLIRPFGRYSLYDPNATRAAAVEFSTGQVMVSDTPALDVFGSHYVAERLNGELGLYEVGKGIQATVKLGAR